MTLDLDSLRSVHFVGIGGIGMSALARFLLARGATVSGSDAAWNEQLDALRSLGADVHAGHDPAYVGDPDLVVVTSAAPGDNAEVIEANHRGIPVVKRAELLAAIANGGRGIAVAGTHGKTTTSALIGHLLVEAGFDPTVLIGGISTSLGSNARVGGGDWIVVEADEYDASFLRLQPEIAVITGVEPDHLDFYGTEDRLRDAFVTFARGVRSSIVVCADDPGALAVTGGRAASRITYGLEEGEVRGRAVRQEAEATRFSLGDVAYTTSLAGLHNVCNCLAAIAVTRAFGIPEETIVAGVATFAGVGRRFERKGEAAGVLVLDDYAHHPTEIAVNLAALKTRYHRPARLVFQPHTYSRTRLLLDRFARSFDGADHVYLMDIYAARESDTLGVSSRQLAALASDHHASVQYTGGEAATLDALLRDTQPGDVVMTMGAGDVHQLGPTLLTRLAERAG